MKAKLPDTIAKAGEPDPMCEKRCNAQDFRYLRFAVMQICDTRKLGNRKTAAKWRKSHPTTRKANVSVSLNGDDLNPLICGHGYTASIVVREP